MQAWTQFKLLLWKNYLLQKRKKIVTIFEIGLPALFALILVFVRHDVESIPRDTPIYYPEFTVDRLPETLIFETWEVAYSPNNTAVKTVMDIVAAKLQVQVRGFQNESVLQTYVHNAMEKEETLQVKVLGGVAFINDFPNETAIPDDIIYKIRLKYSPRAANEGPQINMFNQDKDWKTQYMFKFLQTVGPRNKDDPEGGSPGYYREGFLAIQHAVDISLAQARGANTTGIEVRMQRFPYPGYVDDRFVLVIQQQLGQVLMLSFVYTVLNIVKILVHEKERKLKESMKMMGLNGYLHWFSWFVKEFVFLMITMALFTMLICVKFWPQGKVIQQTDPSIILVYLMLFAISTICFCFAISVFFSKANTGSIVAGVLYFMTYVPFYFITQSYDQMTWHEKMASCLLSNTGMAMGGQVIGMFEGTGAGVQWSTINTGVSVDDDFTMLHVFFMLILDSVLYCMVAWYVEAVFPGDYGVPQPWYFPVLRSYWCGSSKSDFVDEDDNETTPLLSGEKHSDNQGEYFETNPANLKAGVRIRNLRKTFGSGKKKKTAVGGISMDMYEGQITALLGHNGAGKTTTMSMLTGLFPPSGGTALVNGYDIRYNMQSIRQSLGLCPQHDILYDDLTVEEHLYFFAKLKGFAHDKVQAEIDRLIVAMKLEDKRHVRTSALSGGMKRKLSVGIALCANSKIVMLDEPTSGMDPAARRATWDLLQNHRRNRTILLTTHHMDEADLLGDRIAIMAKGTLRCCGSSLFLKNKYGVGYHMVIVKQPGCHVSAVSKVVKSHIPHAKMESNVGAELSYILPTESSAQFEALFTEIEERKEELGIDGYGASITTMEEVFLKVGGDSDPDIDKHLHRAAESYQSISRSPSPTAIPVANGSAAPVANGSAMINVSPTNPEGDDIEAQLLPLGEFDSSVAAGNLKRNTGARLYWQQFYAMFLKHMLHSWRNIWVFLIQFGIPLLYTAFSLIVAKTYPGPQDSPPLNLTTAPYGPNDSPFTAGINPNNATRELAQLYASQFADTPTTPTNISDSSVWDQPPNMTDYLVDLRTKRNDYVYHRVLVASSFQTENDSEAGNGIKATALFNNMPYHTPGQTLVTLDNAILKYLLGENFSVKTINHPMPRTVQDTATDQLSTGITAFAIAFNMVFGMSSLAASFVLFIVRERATKAKHIQFVSGVHSLTFWFSTFAWDIMNFMVPCLLILVLLWGFDVKAYVEDGRVAMILLLFFLYGWSMIPMMYLASFLFTVPSTGFVRITMFNIIAGVATMLAVGILAIPGLDLEDISKGLSWGFSVLPNYCLGQAFSDFGTNYQIVSLCTQDPITEAICKDFNVTWTTNYLQWERNGIGRFLVFMAWEGVFFFGVLFLVESNLLRQFWYFIRPKRKPTVINSDGQYSIQDDEDVARERKRINSTPLKQLFSTDALILKELRKIYNEYSSEPLVAVEGSSLGIPLGETFGLLGINGAGKTTTFKMLTGDETITSGTAYVAGHNIKDDIKRVQQLIGYCPQFDALIDQMTGRETLYMFARLRGVPEKNIKPVVDDLLQALMIEEHADKLTKAYSGGNKRKLSTAIALVGDPPIVFLDEPTTGMDPVARRMLWDSLCQVRQAGRCIVITSHSMEECEALCTCLAIMVNGQFKCLGSTQHLKSRFGEGYMLIAKVACNTPEEERQNILPLKDFIEENFPGSILKDEHYGMVHYHVKDRSLTWARVFGTMERAKSRFNIEDYLVSQTSLEQVFLNFAKWQRQTDE
ncbi:PREDICTED: ATP-binding cassette sub-family A member 3-like [Branchiostoma belcheri]|uniref:ATP-binding cassette sub-family A member 3-like n=1 Tax=Branchiostoma belcheri TaxID=7741 RepID=A0A6P4YUD5_BRABE|nr:PREDICTED: ATP-binding cassette sub-family A member 3-like [Branchiostoma belcheri]